MAKALMPPDAHAVAGVIDYRPCMQIDPGDKAARVKHTDIDL